MKKLTYSEIISHIQSNDSIQKELASSELYSRFKKPIRFTLHNKNIPYDDIDDAVQDVFMKLYSSIINNKLKGRSDGEIVSYVMFTARNHAVDIHRKLKRKPESLPEEFDTPDTSYNIHDMDNLRIANNTLNDIKPNMAECARLGAAGYTHPEIAKKLGLTKSIVDYNIVHARRKIKKQLQ